MSADTLRIEAEVYPIVSHAMAHNRISPVRRVTLHNAGIRRSGLEVAIAVRDAQGVLSEPFTAHADLEANSTTSLRDLAVHLDAAAMNQVEEARPGTLEITVSHAGEVVGSASEAVTVLAALQWLWQPPGLALELLAAHVMPNAPEITQLLGSVGDTLRRTTGQSQIDGYQSGTERVDALVAAVFEAIRGWRVRYSEPPPSWDDGQKIRTPADLFTNRLGTCLDTTLLFSAALEQAGIRPLVWVLKGHALVGWWRHEVDSWSAVSVEVSELINRLDLGQLGVIETTLATERDTPVAFREACSAAELLVRQHPDNVVGVLDVWSARRSHILPLPAIARSEGGGWHTVVYQPAQHSVAPAERNMAISESARATERHGKPVPARVQRWKNALLDLSLRNRLINFSPRGAVRLHVSAPGLTSLEELVLSGRTLTLAAGDTFDDVYRHRDGINRAADLPPSVLDEALLGKSSVFTDLTSDSYLGRLRALAYKARTIEEETGANNLYLALGALVWELDGRQLRSPLVLVPVVLKASGSRGSTYRLVLDEAGSSTPNFCLLEKLRLSFGLSLPTLADPELDDHGIDLEAALRGVRESLVDQGLPFRVEETADVSLLQFAKYRLWKDLADNWEELLTAPLAKHLAHTPTAEFIDPAPAPTNPDLDALGLSCPIPADGSQLAAIADAMAGRTFVLEGPPGTGKSQTIANLLARGIAEGRRILFVAEKRAALEVVSRRVHAIGLGDFTLDLHDHDSRPTAVRRQIARALDLTLRSDSEGLQASSENARAAGAALTRYATRLHDPNSAGLSLYGAETARHAYGAGATLTLPEHLVGPGNAATIESLRGLLRTLPYVADAARPAPVGPWTFAVVDDPAEVNLATVAAAARDIDTLLRQLSALEGAGGLRRVVWSAQTPDDLGLFAELLTRSPLPLALLDEVRTPRWQAATRDLQREYAAFSAAARTALGVATPAALDLPLVDIYARAQAAAQSSWFGRRKRLLAVGAELTPTLTSGSGLHYKEVEETVAGLLHLQATMRQLAERAQAIPGLVIPLGWNPLTVDGQGALDRQVAWLAWVADQLAPGPEARPFIGAVGDFLATADRPPEASRLAVRQLADAWIHVQQSLRAGREDMRQWSGDGGLVPRWLETSPQRETQDPELGSLTRWLGLRQHLSPLHSWGLQAAHTQLVAGEIPSDEASLALERGVAVASLAERRRVQGLTSFDADAHNRTVVRYCENAAIARDSLKGALAAEALGRRSFSSEATSGQIGALRRELSRQRGGLSVRDMMAQYGSLVTEITPCVLVSPDSLARFFPVGSLQFDLVVFDEASQIRVADAIGAIGRASSVVVVGDSLQMPPTSFAEITQRIDDEDDFDSGVIEDEESILSECVQARVKRRWLSWHYRSQDESLIAFSNARYYEGRLSSFPAPTIGAADRGINGHGINQVLVGGTFLRAGKGKALRTNPEEAHAVLSEIQRRFDAAPEGTMPSIGVVTFNAPQRALVEALLRDADDPRLAAALDATTGDGLFVKNLENVQGDERDVILFSTAFSVNERGVLPLNFGPLNLGGGERRLNVAITRARRQVVIYSSFEPSQLRAEETSALGIKHLREYLDIAVGGTDELKNTASRTLVADRHRDDIAARLKERGVIVTTDVGLSDFRVDLQLSRPDTPEQPLVAVLLDGPGWAQRATVNDRDGMPTQVLGAMLRWPAVEWVWLPTWLDAPEAVLDRLEHVLREAKIATLEQETAAIPSGDGDLEVTPTVNPEPAARTAPARVTSTLAGSTSLPEAPKRPVESLAPSATNAPNRFRAWTPRAAGDVSYLDSLENNATARTAVRALLEEGISAEGPIHQHRLAKKVANAFGLTRVAQSRIESILQAGRRRPDQFGFFWQDGVDPQLWRDFRPDQSQDRQLDHISPHELANAMREVARRSGGINVEELKTETREIFGFKRLTAGFSDTLDGALAIGLETGRLRWDQNLIKEA